MQPTIALMMGMLSCSASQASSSPGLTQLRVEHKGEAWEVIRVELDQQALRLTGGEPTDPHTLAELGEVTLAMNAGMYLKDLRPVGLLIQDGVEHAPLELGPGGGGNFFIKPNGVLAWGSGGAWIVESTAWAAGPPEGVGFATQSGPLLVHQGRILPELNPASTSTYTRNGACVSEGDTVVLFISHRAVSLYTAAEFASAALGCREALYLDGGVSVLRTRSGTMGHRRGSFGPFMVVD